MAQRAHGVTGEVLLQLIESRIDNVVYRMGIAPTRSAARQLVGHNHITVNGNVVNIPSYILKAGDTVAVRERSKSMEVISNCVAGSANAFPWMDFDKTSMSGKFISVPERVQIPENIKEQLIVELYSK
jgi:small subunit ribosomal protein S4